MDCGKCSEKEERVITFNDGHVSIILWCEFYKKPCHSSYKNCKLRILDEESARKAIKAMRIGSKRKDNYDG